jgi:hypothetical protein
MTANNDTYIASVKAAGVQQKISQATAIMSEQATLDASRSVVGYREGFPTGNATYVAACQAAAAQLRIDRANAEMAKQSAIMVAADLIRAQGEKPT